MKMVSSAKLRKAQRAIENFYPYEQRMMSILNHFISGQDECPASVYSQVRPVSKVALVVFSSNSSLCGSFNSNVQKKLQHLLLQYKDLGKDNVMIFPVGKKISKSIVKQGYKPQGNFETLADKPNYNEAAELAEKLMDLFKERSVDKVELVYHHFKSKASQVLVDETILPLNIQSDGKKGITPFDAMIEPDAETIMRDLLPMVVKLRFYTALLDSNASEHAARTVAMQTASDNADDLLQELSLQYNKSRQQAITNELLDIIGGSFK